MSPSRPSRQLPYLQTGKLRPRERKAQGRQLGRGRAEWKPPELVAGGPASCFLPQGGAPPRTGCSLLLPAPPPPCGERGAGQEKAPLPFWGGGSGERSFNKKDLEEEDGVPRPGFPKCSGLCAKIQNYSRLSFPLCRPLVSVSRNYAPLLRGERLEGRRGG